MEQNFLELAIWGVYLLDQVHNLSGCGIFHVTACFICKARALLAVFSDCTDPAVQICRKKDAKFSPAFFLLHLNLISVNADVLYMIRYPWLLHTGST